MSCAEVTLALARPGTGAEDDALGSPEESSPGRLDLDGAALQRGRLEVFDALRLGMLQWSEGELTGCCARARELLGPLAERGLEAFEPVDTGPRGPQNDARWVRVAGPPRRIVEIAPYPAVAQPRYSGVSVVRDVTREYAIVDALRDAEEERETFAYRASHDLLGPARRTRMFCELLSSAGGLDPEKTNEFAVRAARSAERMAELVHALLEYSRSGNCARPLNLCAMDLRNVVARSLGARRVVLEIHRGAAIEVDVVGVVAAHAEALETVLAAVLGNALLYREPDRTAAVRVESLEEGNSIVLRVTDEGLGVAPEHLGKVFAPFERLHAYTAYPGHGLGLATARRWVERMKGTLELTASEPGEGSTFSVRLPKAGNDE